MENKAKYYTSGKVSELLDSTDKYLHSFLKILSFTTKAGDYYLRDITKDAHLSPIYEIKGFKINGETFLILFDYETELS
ncbi:MAG: hypothetical protein Q9M91_00475 [Candidatus Dojkabacteria bacterium]|nr:hypothetical protein [Candidatus Dojkabacteria bacterium]